MEKITTTKWILPCNLYLNEYGSDAFEIDLTKYLKIILNNEVWKRVHEYGFSLGLKKTKSTEIKKAIVTILPNFIEGSLDRNRIGKSIDEQCGKSLKDFNISSYKTWPYNKGFLSIQIDYNFPLNYLPPKSFNEDLIYFPKIMKVMEFKDQKLGVSKELAHLFLAALHLCFPMKSLFLSDQNPLLDGFFYIRSTGKSYISKQYLNKFQHPIFYDKNKSNYIVEILEILAKVWSKDLWPIKRYLIAVESDQISNDNLLDLIYSLEGLFEKNVSSQFIKTMCILIICKSKQEANDLKWTIDKAFYIRNEIAHGGKYFGYLEELKNGKLVQDIYWDMKTIVAKMIIYCLKKMSLNEKSNNLVLNTQDFIDISFRN